MEKYKDTRRVTPPDGGYGWIILVATILINITALPMLQCFGIIFQDKFNALGINATKISFMLHLNNSITCILGLFSGAILNRFTYREVCITGSILVCCGICLTSFANSYAFYIFSTCVLIGSGLGIMLPAMSVAVNTYFKERLTLVMTIQVTGTSVSPIFMPQLCKFFLNEFGTDGTVLILGGISMHAFLGSLLLKPLTENKKLNLIDCDNMNVKLRLEEIALQSREGLRWEMIPDSVMPNADMREDQEQIPSNAFGRLELISDDDVTDKSASQDLLQKPNNGYGNNEAINSSHQVVYRGTTVPIMEKLSFWEKMIKFCSFNLLKDRLYLILLIGMSISFASELNIAFLMPFVLSELVMFDMENVANAMSVHAIADIVGRLSVPILSFALLGFTPKMLYCCSLILSSLGRTVLIFSQNKLGALCAVTIIGYGKGTKAVLQSLILPYYMPFDKFAAALGLMMAANGMVSLIIGPIIGFVHDLSDSYVPSLYSASVLSLFCVILWLVDYWLTLSAKMDKEDASRNDAIEPIRV